MVSAAKAYADNLYFSGMIVSAVLGGSGAYYVNDGIGDWLDRRKIVQITQMKDDKVAKLEQSRVENRSDTLRKNNGDYYLSQHDFERLPKVTYSSLILNEQTKAAERLTELRDNINSIRGWGVFAGVAGALVAFIGGGLGLACFEKQIADFSKKRTARIA